MTPTKDHTENTTNITPSTSAIFNDLMAMTDALLNEVCDSAFKEHGIEPDHLLALHELSIRIDMLLETLEEQRRIHIDTHTVQ